MTEEPKPCPFCGGEAHIVFSERVNYEGHHAASCKQCFAEGQPAYLGEPRAATYWNKRPLESAAHERGRKETIAVVVAETVKRVSDAWEEWFNRADDSVLDLNALEAKIIESLLSERKGAS